MDLKLFTPDQSASHRHELTLVNGCEYRIEFPDELLPESVTDAGDGITAYEMRLPPDATGWHAEQGSYLLYVGPRDALLDPGFAPPEAAKEFNGAPPTRIFQTEHVIRNVI